MTAADLLIEWAARLLDADPSLSTNAAAQLLGGRRQDALRAVSAARAARELAGHVRYVPRPGRPKNRFPEARP